MQAGRHARPRYRRYGVLLASLTVITLLGISACDALNPSFIDLFAFGPDDTAGSFQAVDPPIGHVPIIFRNSARISDQVFKFVIQGDNVVREEVVDELIRVNPQMTREQITSILQDVIDDTPVDLEVINLPPRVRLTVDVTLTDGGVQRLEFLDGLRLIRGEDLVGSSSSAAALPPDLTENTNNVYIVQCDIAQIEVVRFDVFIPVVIREIICEEFEIFGGGCFSENCILELPRFDNLDPDTGLSEESGTFQTLRNYDPRFYPPAITNLQCGAVVIIELTGDLTIPFRSPTGPRSDDCLPSTNPPADQRIPGFRSYQNIDMTEELLIPGRYAASISIRDQ